MNKYVCTRCWEIYDHWYKYDKNGRNYCPKSGCMGPVEEIDELMLPIIIMLNKKGYRTDFCCSGHLVNDLTERNSAYISFVDLPPEIKMPALPRPWYWDIKSIIRCDNYKNDNPYTLYNYWLNDLIVLMVWVEQLEDISEKE